MSTYDENVNRETRDSLPAEEIESWAVDAWPATKTGAYPGDERNEASRVGGRARTRAAGEKGDTAP